MTRANEVEHSAPIESDSGGGVSFPTDVFPTDSEILDWLSNWNETGRIPGKNYGVDDWRIRTTYGGQLGSGTTLREAVADAMRTETGRAAE